MTTKVTLVGGISTNAKYGKLVRLCNPQHQNQKNAIQICIKRWFVELNCYKNMNFDFFEFVGIYCRAFQNFFDYTLMFWVFLWDSVSFSIHIYIYIYLYEHFFVLFFWILRIFENMFFATFVQINGPKWSLLPPSPFLASAKSPARGQTN